MNLNDEQFDKGYDSEGDLPFYSDVTIGDAGQDEAVIRVGAAPPPVTVTAPE